MTTLAKANAAVGRTRRPRLADIQRDFVLAIFRPLDAHDQADWHGPGGREAAMTARELVKPGPTLPSLDRLEIYNRQYWFRLWDCLQEDYPGLRTILGSGRFMALTTRYLQRFPSRSYTLRNLGRSLGEHMARDRQWRVGLTPPRVKLAREMAAFEWAQVEAFDGPMEPPVALESLRGKDPAKLRLALQPSMSLLELHWALDDFAIALKKELQEQASQASTKQGAASANRRPSPRAERVFLAVHRVDDSLYYKRLSAPAYRTLMELRGGATLARAAQRGSAALAGNMLERAQTVQSWFALWSQLGWLCSPPPARSASSQT